MALLDAFNSGQLPWQQQMMLPGQQPAPQDLVQGILAARLQPQQPQPSAMPQMPSSQDILQVLSQMQKPTLPDAANAI